MLTKCLSSFKLGVVDLAKRWSEASMAGLRRELSEGSFGVVLN